MTASHSNSAFRPSLPPFIFGGLLLSLVVAGCSDGSEPDDDSGASSGGAMASGGVEGVGGDSTTGGAPGAGGEMGVVDYPTDSSQAGVEAFLAAESYKSAPWVGDAAGRTTVPLDGNPHGATVVENGGTETLRTYFNTAGREAKEAGDSAVAAINAMSVKEVYDASGTLLARLVRLKTGEGSSRDDWVSYCDAPTDPSLCATSEGTSPVYEDGGFNGCATCHGNANFLAPLPQ